MSAWKILLVVYDRIAASYQDPVGGRRWFEHAMTAPELRDGLEAFREFPVLVDRLTSGAARIECDVLRADRPLGSVSPIWTDQFWPSPDDTRPEWRPALRARAYRSILVYWPQHDLAGGASIPSHGWGWGMGASAQSGNATYGTVANAPARHWQVPLMGEVWLHEWLHGACAHFAALGHIMPERDADGGGLHGYTQSPATGWTDYYRDLMNAQVCEGDRRLGIPPEAWREESA